MELKDFAKLYVDEHDHLTEGDKEMFYNYIDKSKEDEIAHLLLTGKKLGEGENFILREESRWRIIDDAIKTLRDPKDPGSSEHLIQDTIMVTEWEQLLPMRTVLEQLSLLL